MKKIWISPYTLEVAGKGEARDGFLLKLQTGDFEAGYADCFPWQSFGDPSTDQLIEWIQPEKSNPLLVRSLYFARLDGEARAQSRKLLNSQVSIKNHFLVTDMADLTPERVDEMVGLGFTSFKLKVGGDCKMETQQLKSCFASVFGKVKIRLDFNCRLNSTYREFIDICQGLEFVEDPTQTSEEWSELKKDWDFPVALDQATKNKYFDLQVIKPAKQGEQDYLTKDLIFTSYLDHPVGQAFALHQAQEFGEQKRDYGLMSQHIYEPNIFSEYLVSQSNTFSVTGDLGIGFDDLWSRVEWQRII